MDRRSLLAAGMATAATFGAAPSAFSLRADTLPTHAYGWAAIHAAFVKADTKMKAYDRDFLTPASDHYRAWRDQWPYSMGPAECPRMAAEYSQASALYDPIEKRYDELRDARLEARLAMIECPAPDLSAVIFKVQTLISDEQWDCEGFADEMAVLAADLQRIQGVQ